MYVVKYVVYKKLIHISCLRIVLKVLKIVIDLYLKLDRTEKFCMYFKASFLLKLTTNFCFTCVSKSFKQIFIKTLNT